MSSSAARREWATMWPLPIVAMLGVAGSGIFAYASGIVMEDMTRAFGWSRAQFSTAFVLQMGLGLFAMPAVGWLIDRIGARRVALIGILPFMGSLALLGLANGSIWQWWLLCLLLAAFQAFVAQVVWVTAVVGRFEASRGLAMAVALAGLSLAILIWPILAAFYLRTFGWQAVMPALALTWGVVALPLTALFFFGPQRGGAVSAAPKKAASYRKAFWSRTFVGLMVAGGLFSSAYYGLIVHMVPILKGKGIDLTTAAALAGIMGAFSIIGRLGTGYLLDRLPTRPIGVVIFLAPILASALLWHGEGSVKVAAIAVAILGFASGAEFDLVTFIAARRFGHQVFGSIYSVFVAIISVCASTGPMLAGALFDASGSYDLFLLAMMPMALAGALLMAWIPLAPTGEPETAEPAPA